MQARWALIGIVATVSACSSHERDDRARVEATSVRAGAASTPKTATTPTISTNNDFRYQFVDAVKAISPAVVSVTSVSVVKAPAMPEGSPLQFFFRGADPHRPEALRRGIGSGVIVDGRGDVLTNNHVVEGAETVKVVLANGHELPAKVVGTDAASDLAVIKVSTDHEQLQAAELGDSDALQVGEWVVAAGSPFGLRQTVSAGIVSAIGRGNVGISEYENFIQTDAAINPGNSGGPVVDLSGRVVGISTAIASQSGGNNGVGFAIPIAMAKLVMDQLIRTGKVVRGYIGLYIGDVTQELAESFDFKESGGALVQDVTPNAPGARAGVRPGDIIFERDAKAIANASAFRNGIAGSPPGTETTFKIWRDGKERELKVTLSELPTPEERAQVGSPPSSAPEHARWGVQLTDPTPELRQRLELGEAHGALIVDVKPNSPAAESGLHEADLITNVGGREIQSAADAQKALSDAKSPLRLRVVRQGHGIFVVLSAKD